MRIVARTWAQYRRDRAIELGESLAGAECASERNAFLALLAAVVAPTSAIAGALSLIRRMAIRPLLAEFRQSEAIIATSLPELEAVRQALTHAALPQDPLGRLVWLVDRFRYSSADSDEHLRATALSPCWAINLMGVARAEAMILTPEGIPFPGLVERRAFRADRSSIERREYLQESLAGALDGTCDDIAGLLQAHEAFHSACSGLQANSRAYPAWLLIHALGQATPSQLGRALQATKAGARKVLGQLEERGLVKAPSVAGYFTPANRFATLRPRSREA